MNLRGLERRDWDAVAALLYEAFARFGRDRGQPPPWNDLAEVRTLVERYAASGVVAEAGGAIVGAGFVRIRGEVATLGPIAVAAPGRGNGGQLLDELIGRAEGQGAIAIRLYQEASNPEAFALFSGRRFTAVDVVAQIERSSGTPPRLDAARGLEMTPLRPADLGEVAALDLRLTGLERRDDLSTQVRLVARRRGAIVGFLGIGSKAQFLGPAVALDVADLGALIARALIDTTGTVRARLSTAAPTAMLAALGLGFRVTSVGTMMVRGVTPPARPPQLYSIVPEIL